MRKPLLILATLGVAALSAVPPAKADLVGAQVSYNFLFPNTSTVGFSVGPQTISSSTSIVDTFAQITTTFTGTEIIITNNLAGSFGTASFTGPQYLFSGVTISGVSIDPASAADFLGAPTFTANQIMINFEGLPFVQLGDKFILDVTSTSAVPEPASLALLCTGLLGLPILRRIRRRRYPSHRA